MYYYLYNAQGDVVGMYDNTGELVCEYLYDSWGKVIHVRDYWGTEITDPNHVSNVNPIRYRGYYYDIETGLYYLQSRFYNPEWGRFVNADGLVQTSSGGMLSTNMFIYCENNPVNYYDPTGTDCICLRKRVGMGHVCNNPSRAYVVNTSRYRKTAINVISPAIESGIQSGLDIGRSSLKNSARPANIGVGSYKKYVTSSIAKIDNVSKITKFSFEAMAYIGVGIEVGQGVYQNISYGQSVGKVVWDAAVDTAILGGCTYAASAIGGAIGSAIPIPVVGTIAGVACGFEVGVVLDRLLYDPRKSIKSMY